MSVRLDKWLHVTRVFKTRTQATHAVDLNRVRMTLVEQDGKWLVSELDAL